MQMSNKQGNDEPPGVPGRAHLLDESVTNLQNIYSQFPC